MKNSTKSYQTSAQKPQSIRLRAGSTPGLDSKQIHSLINRSNTFNRILCKDTETVDSPCPTGPPTRSCSVVSIGSTDTLVNSGRFIQVAPAKLQHDTVSIISDESETLETPRTLISISNIDFYETSSDSPNSTLSPTSPQFSDNDISDVFEKVKIAAPASQEVAPSRPVLPLRSLYLDEVVWQIDDVVFAAAIDAVHNNSLMCRLNIEFICEIADENADHVQETKRQNRGFDCPCFCNRASSHFRYYLSYSLPETEQRCMQLTEDTKLNDMFDGFIDLVQRARRAKRSVLVCSTRGRNRAPAFASAYLMHKEQITRQQAVAKVRNAMGTMRPPVNISDFMQRKLMRYQQHLGIDVSNAYDPAHTIPLFHVKRSAWT